MSRCHYCRRQAELLFAMAFAVRDEILADGLRMRAEQYLAEAEVASDPSETLERAIRLFNEEQMRGA